MIVAIPSMKTFASKKGPQSPSWLTIFDSFG